MAARLAFAVCAHADADILIVDEALSVGDEAFGAKCDAFIKDFANHGTILVVSHDLETLQTICDRVIWIEDGVVQSMGAPKDVIARYREAIEGNAGAGARRGLLTCFRFSQPRFSDAMRPRCALLPVPCGGPSPVAGAATTGGSCPGTMVLCNYCPPGNICCGNQCFPGGGPDQCCGDQPCPPGQCQPGNV